MEIITAAEAASLCREICGFRIAQSTIMNYTRDRFRHLGVFKFNPQSGRITLCGINKSAWLNFINGRRETENRFDLFSSQGWAL
jgi:hypothetical protein